MTAFNSALEPYRWLKRALAQLCMCGMLVSAAPAIGRAATCDGGACDPSIARADVVLQSVSVWSRAITLHVSYADGTGWASIDNGDPGDEVWLDRSADAGNTWEGKLGDTIIPQASRGWRTQMYALVKASQPAQLRACGKAGNRDEISCTTWLPVCFGLACDGSDPASAGGAERANPPQSWIWYRRLVLHMWDVGHAAWASIENGDPGDEVWIDRSWDGGQHWDGKLGDTLIPNEQRGWRSWVYAFDDSVHGGTAALRVCGKARDRDEIGCTPWIRANDRISDMHAAAVDSLMARYDRQNHIWGQIGWWSANAVTSLLDYMEATGDCREWPEISQIHAKGADGQFENDYNDDIAWWALAWANAYRVGRTVCAPGNDAENDDYLNTARALFGHMKESWDDGACGGGIPWQRSNKNYKNAIANELYFKLAAELAVLGNHDSRYTDVATQTWNFLRANIKTDSRGLIKDDFVTCGVENSSAETWTYNQGVLLGGIAYYYQLVPDPSILDYGVQLADAVVNPAAPSTGLLSNGILREDCETRAQPCIETSPNPSSDDATLFKGAFARNLHEFAAVAASAGRPTDAWQAFFVRQRDSIIANDRSAWAEFGFHWAGPIRITSDDSVGTQVSALDVFNATVGR